MNLWNIFTPSVKKVFWAISNDISDSVRLDANQADRQSGIVSIIKNPNITIWVKTWSQIIDDSQSRLRFFQERLEYTADRDSALEHLRETHGRLLSNSPLITRITNTDTVGSNTSHTEQN